MTRFAVTILLAAAAPVAAQAQCSGEWAVVPTKTGLHLAAGGQTARQVWKTQGKAALEQFLLTMPDRVVVTPVGPVHPFWKVQTVEVLMIDDDTGEETKFQTWVKPAQCHIQTIGMWGGKVASGPGWFALGGFTGWISLRPLQGTGKWSMDAIMLALGKLFGVPGLLALDVGAHGTVALEPIDDGCTL